MTWYKKLFSALACTLCAATLTACNNAQQQTTTPQSTDAEEIPVLTPAEFSAQLAEDETAFLLDVRKPDEFAEGHLAGATLLNWLDPDTFKQEAQSLDKSKTIYVYCRSGRRSNEAANYLASQGYKVVDMKGGILAWQEAGKAVVKE